MTLKLNKAPRFLRDESGKVVRNSKGHASRDEFLDNFEDEVVRLLLFLLAERRWTGNRFEGDLLGIPLFLRRVKNRKANGWEGYFGTGTEIGRCDGSWKILIGSLDPNRISAERAQKILDIGWKNLTSKDDYDLAPDTDVMGYPRGLASVIDATEILGLRDIFTQDMMMMRLYSTER